MTQDIFAAIAKAKGRDAAARPGAPTTPFSDAAAERRRKAEEKAWANAVAGDIMPDGSICVGGRDITFPQSARAHFNVYAAPENLPGHLGYQETLDALAAKKNWHGFDGEPYASEEALDRALRDGSYGGGWIMPPDATMIVISHVDGMPDSLFPPDDTDVFPSFYYWALKKNDAAEKAWISDLSRETPGSTSMGIDDAACRCRPVRLVKMNKAPAP